MVYNMDSGELSQKKKEMEAIAEGEEEENE